MDTVTSRDGTTIAYDRTGSGPALVIVDGALCSRAFGPGRELAQHLASRFTVLVYDRRGRGDSTDTPPYAVAREVEDLAAVVEAAGGTASVVGTSSGAALALEAARTGVPIAGLVLYEAPFVVDAGDGTRPVPDDFADRLEAAVASGRRGDAVRMFMAQVGTPALAVAIMRVLPVWRRLCAVAHTLPNDIRCLGGHSRGAALDPQEWASVTAPTLVLAGSRSPAPMRRAMQALAAAVPGAQHRTLPGQTHLVKARVLAPVVADFLGAGAAAGAAAS